MSKLPAAGSKRTPAGLELIPSVLARLGRPLLWVHLGDGPERLEIVNDATWIILEPEAAVEAMAEGLTTTLDLDRFDRAEIRHFFAEHFEASTNYNSFADALIVLWEDQASAA